jgi:hypothetical protein
MQLKVKNANNAITRSLRPPKSGRGTFRFCGYHRPELLSSGFRYDGSADVLDRGAFKKTLGLPILRRVENMEHVNLLGGSLIDSNLAVSFGLAADEDVLQVRADTNRSALGVICGQSVNGPFQVPEVGIRVGNAIWLGIPLPDAG